MIELCKKCNQMTNHGCQKCAYKLGQELECKAWLENKDVMIRFAKSEETNRIVKLITDIKEYLIKEKEVTISEISDKFNIDTVEARKILDIIGQKLKGDNE